MLLEQLVKLSNKLDKNRFYKEADLVDQIIMALAKKTKEEKWMQKAVPKKTEGDFATWCKRKGYKGVCQSCINDAVATGGHAAKMANFAVNASNGKYIYPKKKK